MRKPRSSASSEHATSTFVEALDEFVAALHRIDLGELTEGDDTVERLAKAAADAGLAEGTWQDEAAELRRVLALRRAANLAE